MLSAAISSSYTWLRSRRIRYLLLCACSPILCLALPFLCAADLCLRFFRRRRRREEASSDAREAEKLRRCEEGCCGCAAAAAESGGDQVVLLQRYLEDQLLLVRYMYDCGDFDDDEDSDRRPLL